ncbi:BatD family protein [Oceaniserpentilla sp. 4NH20-0058]|uniref:BatD family protein n=1 Tax=Oceaniserpentilla sp. 4NH20-0058 TaxID=3127660 RepID=UPI00310B94F6
MVRHALLFIMLSLLANLTWATTFEASVDRSTIGEGESLFLTLRYNSNVSSGEPDLSALNQQFEIENQQRKNSFQYINGKSESWTVWTVTLTPKRKGNLVLPSIEYQGERTKPIQINVEKINPNIAKQDKDVFFHTETDVKTSYVQGQVVYSEKLYFSVPLDNSQLSEVAVEDAVLEALGETRQYRTQLNGRSFEVYERRFVIYPQTSGELIIPGPRYSGEISNGRWRPGRPISVSHPPIRLQVLPQPANYPQNSTWLPAKNFDVSAKWLGNETQMNAGDPVTLSITLKANGLSSAHLPAIKLPEVNGLKYYPEQAQKNESNNDSGVTSWLTQNIAVVATQGGDFIIPEIRIPWFNTEDGRAEYAILPAQTLKVASSIPQNKSIVPAASPMDTNSTAIIPEVSGPIKQPASRFWPVVSLLFMLLWLTTSYFLWRAHQTPNKVKPKDQSNSPNNNILLKNIKKSCRNNDAKSTREAILAWAQSQKAEAILNLDNVASLHTSSELKQALQELDYTLYSPSGNSAWQGEHLWQLIRNLKPESTKDQVELPPLYPSSV